MRPDLPHQHHAPAPPPHSCYEETEEHGVLDQEIWVLAQALPLLSLHSCGVLPCKIGTVVRLLRSSASPYEGQVRSRALKRVVTGQPRAQMCIREQDS